MPQFPVSPWFTPDFDGLFGQALIKTVPMVRGCFACGTPNPKNRCSRCKVAMYCNRDCQKISWAGKGGCHSHKEICDTYVENQQSGCSEVPVLLASVGWIEEDFFVEVMRERQQLFLSSAATAPHPVAMHFQCAVVDLLEKLRVVVACSFFDRKTFEVQQVNRILVEVVQDEVPRKYKFRQELSDRAFQKVVDAWVVFYDEMKKNNVEPISICCGSGLWDRVDELTAKLEAKGVTIQMGFQPSTDYVAKSMVTDMNDLISKHFG